MKRESEIRVYKGLTMISIDFGEDRISSAKERVGALLSFLEKEFGLEDDQVKTQLGIPVCICDDGRGWSTCGGECPVHRPNYFCSCGGCKNCVTREERRGCSKKVAYMKACVLCSKE